MNEKERNISQFEPDVQEKQNTIRQIFFEVLPDTEESIRYKIPAYNVGQHHLYIAAYKKHIDFYPVYNLVQLEDQLSKYRAKITKDRLHFLLNKPLHSELIKNIINLKSKL
jgi:uncharacterized protein YdhG (YjbR/CyaY superfamily)